MRKRTLFRIVRLFRISKIFGLFRISSISIQEKNQKLNQESGPASQKPIWNGDNHCYAEEENNNMDNDKG